MCALALATVGVVGADVAHTAPVPSAGHVRAKVAFIGDSNIAFGATAIAEALTERNEPYELIDLASGGTSIRAQDCPAWTPCTTFNYWKLRLSEARAVPGAWVVNLGINDTWSAGTATSPGWVGYPAKIDWLMALLGSKPVIWTNLPCHIEPATLRTPCVAINQALAAAPARWPNLTILDWRTVANAHPEWMIDFGKWYAVHYDAAGQTAWATLVAKALDARFPA